MFNLVAQRAIFVVAQSHIFESYSEKLKEIENFCGLDYLEDRKLS